MKPFFSLLALLCLFLPLGEAQAYASAEKRFAKIMRYHYVYFQLKVEHEGNKYAFMSGVSRYNRGKLADKKHQIIREKYDAAFKQWKLEFAEYIIKRVPKKIKPLIKSESIGFSSNIKRSWIGDKYDNEVSLLKAQGYKIITYEKFDPER